jgi:hypothetical protein
MASTTGTTSAPVNDWGNTMYDGLSGVGTFKADLGLVIGVIVGCALIVFGIYFMMNDDSDNYLRVDGTVVQPNCVKSSVSYDDKGRPTDNFKCNMIVQYTIDGKSYSKKMYLTGTTSYIKDEPVKLMVAKNNYEDVQLVSMDKTTLGSILMVVALVIVGLTYLNYYLTHNYKVFAAAQGAETVVGLFR